MKENKNKAIKPEKQYEESIIDYWLECEKNEKERIEREKKTCWINQNLQNDKMKWNLRYAEDKIKCKIWKKVEKDFYEYWKLDENVKYWVELFISFIALYLTHMKLKQSKHEKELGEMKKEITRNRKEKRSRDIEKIHKYIDKKWDKIERRKISHIIHNKEADHEAIRKIIEYRERLKQENRGIYHHLQGNQISYIYKTSSTVSNEKWKKYWKEKIRLRCPYIKKEQETTKENHLSSTKRFFGKRNNILIRIQ
jgi:hypothetical protein